MSNLMTALIIVVIVVSVFCVGLLIYDLVSDHKAKKIKNTDEVVLNPNPSSDLVKEEEKPVEEKITEQKVLANDSSEITFSKGKETIDEKYNSLNNDYKAYYDEVVRYANNIEGIKRVKTSAYEDYKIGNNKVVRLKIKRDTVICEFAIANIQFKNYLKDNKVSVKQSTSVIKLLNDESLEAVKNSIDFAKKNIEEEKAYKKEQAKIRRKEAREKKLATKANEQSEK